MPPIGPRVSITIHRHGNDYADDITDDVIKVEWSQSISAPWQSLTVTWKATVGDSFIRVMEGDWVLFRIISGAAEGRGPITALLHVDSTSGGISVTNIGGVYTNPCTFKATSWFNFLGSLNIYSVLGWVEDIGTMFSMTTWSKMIAFLTTDYVVGNLGEAFNQLLEELTKRIKVPPTLRDNTNPDLTLWDCIIPTTTQAEADDIFINRPVESIDIAGGSPTRLQAAWGPFESSVLDFIMGTFVPDPMLIELFPSSEPANLVGRQVTTPPGAFGAYQTLILRMKPFREVPLKNAVVSQATYNHAEVERAMRWAVDLAMKNKTGVVEAEAIGRDVAKRVEDLKNRTNNSVEQFLEGTFYETTWDYQTSTHIDEGLLRSMTWSRDDRSRINCASIKLSFDGQSGIEGLLGAGLPITYDEEILRHGLRVAKPTWSYMINISKRIRERAIENKARKAAGVPLLNPVDASKTKSDTDGDWIAYARTICAQFMQFYKNNHMYLKGTMTLNLTEAITNEGINAAPPVLDQAPMSGATTGLVNPVYGTADKVLFLRHGERFAISLDRNVDVIYGYCETISHSFQIRDGGIEAASTQIDYSRGHVGVSADVLGKSTEVPLRKAREGKPYVKNPAATNNGCSYVSVYYGGVNGNPDKQVQIGIRIYATMRAAGFSPAFSFALAHHASFESGWDPGAVKWCRRPSKATAMGLFQMTSTGYAGPTARFQNNRPGNTSHADTFDPNKEWDTTDPHLHCKRIIAGLYKMLGTAPGTNKPLESHSTINDAFKTLWYKCALTSGAKTACLSLYRASLGADTYREARANISSAVWSSDVLVYSFNNPHGITQPINTTTVSDSNCANSGSTSYPGFVIKFANPNGFNISGKAKITSPKSLTFDVSSSPGSYADGGVVYTNAWFDNTFSDRYIAAEKPFDPNINYFNVQGSYDAIGVNQGIYKLLDQRFRK